MCESNQLALYIYGCAHLCHMRGDVQQILDSIFSQTV